MKRILSGLVALLCCATALGAAPRTESLLTDWKFTRDDSPEFSAARFDDRGWQQVTVPHDWAIYGPFDKEIDMQRVAIEQNGERIPTEKTGRTGALPYIGTGWYRTSFRLAPEQAGKRVVITFDGAMSDAQVWVNGRKAGNWPYGYSTFWFDLSELVVPGENTVAVRLENLERSSRWYPGAGLYRPVHLTVCEPFSIEKWGVTVTTPEADEQWASVEVRTAFTRPRADGTLRIDNKVFDGDGRQVTSASSQDVRLYGGCHRTRFILPSPRLWSPETPELYTLLTEVYLDDRLVDTDTTRFGVRTLSFTPERGFELNGKQRKIKGVCLHHDLGPLGAAVNEAALRRQIRILKQMGCDAIRTAHNMPSPQQMDICDEMGMMVMAESFDEWMYAKCKNGYNRFFAEWYERDLTNLVRCHRNHPSIIMWSTGNEIPEQGARDGQKWAYRLQQICHREDPTRPVTNGMDRVDAAIANQFAATHDIVGLNYRTHKYRTAYDALPQGFILGSETASTVSSRGVYKFPVQEYKDKRYDDGQCSSYDLEACNWSNIPEDDWLLQDDQQWVIGEFVWTGFDYLGEPTPYDEVWPSRSSYFGICDLAGLPKDRYYLYRSRWNTAEPTLHILPHWNWQGREGETTPVFVYTSYPSAELFVNGVSQGRRTKDPASRENRYRLRWNEVEYQPGTLRAVAYDADGNAVAEKEIRTAGAPRGLVLEADRRVLKADGRDLSFITVRAVDKQGNFCPLADNALEFSVSGEGAFRAVCNGDATSTELFHLPAIKLFNGMAVVIVRSTDRAGEMELTVKGRNLKTAALKIRTE
ncbi:MAG: DUF4982 domain-containing protein [Rikenellaceae bacterium]|nr:DUF4982 domain-containing protein [Rikenellaceae bacterium]